MVRRSATLATALAVSVLAACGGSSKSPSAASTPGPSGPSGHVGTIQQECQNTVRHYYDAARHAALAHNDVEAQSVYRDAQKTLGSGNPILRAFVLQLGHSAAHPHEAVPYPAEASEIAASCRKALG
jgi:hypothetical protein